jgi:2-oxoglutarate dehydrogenase E2 component (dihydrolipoamide succinyltransferase)
MPHLEVVLPEMGESVVEATVTSWLKNVGDTVEVDEVVVEVATDKVDSEIVSEYGGRIVEIRATVDQVVKVGEVLFVVDSESNGSEPKADAAVVAEISNPPSAPIAQNEPEMESAAQFTEQVMHSTYRQPSSPSPSRGFLSPLVRSIAEEEGVTEEELSAIKGTGLDERITKEDILNYVARRLQPAPQSKAIQSQLDSANQQADIPEKTPAMATKSSAELAAGDERIALNRMAKLTAKNMLESVLTSAHVQSFIEVDVTAVVEWRAAIKQQFERVEGEKLTFTPIFIEAVARALKAYPQMNIQFDGEAIIQKKAINIGMAAALEDGSLIVPVIKEADMLNLSGLAQKVNDLASRARNKALKPDEVMNATYTVTNIGSFGSVFGTPIIPQPQVGILAIGAIRKVPAVVETAQGEFLGIRHKMYLSHSYDHRVVNGALGGLFIKFIADYLEKWDVNRSV